MQQQENLNRQLFQAIFNRQVQGVRQLLNRGANPNTVDPQTQFTPLHLAASDPNPNTRAILDLLVENGADIDTTIFNEMSPLRIAIDSNASQQIIRHILKMGASIQNLPKNTILSSPPVLEEALMYLTKKARFSRKRYKTQDEIQSPLQHAGGGGRTVYPERQSQKGLLLKKQPSSLQSVKQSTDLLFQGLEQRNLEKVKQAIENGAKLNTRKKGETPLTFFLERNTDEELILNFIKVLLANGANVNYEDQLKRSPLWYAMMDGKQKVTTYLKKKGGKTNQQLKHQVFNYITGQSDFDIGRRFKQL